MEPAARVRVSACPAAFRCAPAAGEVLAWVIDLGQPPVPRDDLFARLTTVEQERALRYKMAKPREEFVIGRGLLRGLLGELLDCDPRTVPLAYLPSGKPFVDASGAPHFNLTHTDGVAVLAVANRRVGVDVERVRPVLNAPGLVKRYFSAAECAAFETLHESARPAAFFRGWTCKEAVVKAAGATVSCLADFDVDLDPSRAPSVLGVRAEELTGDGWALAHWALQNVAIAVALEGAGPLSVEGDAA
jgi:4'-phosphopantetheinyl transferase